MPSFFRNKNNILLLCILAFAAFLRLYRIGDYMTFLGDEGRDVLVVYNILHGHFTLLGPTSSVGGFFLGPIYYYFMAPFLWVFNYSPVGPAVMIALLGVVTVWLVYKMAREFFGLAAGLIASSLYAISPLVIAYSRSSWNPNPMPFFTLLTLYLLYRAGVKELKIKGQDIGRINWLFVWVGVLFGVMMQLHYLAVFVGVIILAYGVFLMRYCGKRRIVFGYLGIFLGFLVGFSPYLAFEARHGFPNTISIIKFIFHSPEVGGSGNFLGIVSNVFLRLFGRLITNYPPPEQFDLINRSVFDIWTGLTWVLGIFCVWFLFVFWKKARKDREKYFQNMLLIIWLVIGVLLFGFYRKMIYDYYLAFLYPVPFLLVGGLAAFLWHKKRWVKLVVFACLGALFLINLSGVPFRYPPNRQLQQVENISRFVVSKTDDKPFNFALITGSNSDFAYRYFFTIWGREPVTILNPSVDPMRKSVADELLVVCETLPCHPLGASLWEVAGFGRAEIVGHWSVSVVEIYKLQHYKGK